MWGPHTVDRLQVTIILSLHSSTTGSGIQEQRQSVLLLVLEAGKTIGIILLSTSYYGLLGMPKSVAQLAHDGPRMAFSPL